MAEHVVTPAPQLYPMTREQRRAHYREAKKDPIAIYCPRCTHKTRHVAMPMYRRSAEDRKEKTCKCNIVCVACGNILRTDMDLIPYEYVKQVPAV